MRFRASGILVAALLMAAPHAPARAEIVQMASPMRPSGQPRPIRWWYSCTGMCHQAARPITCIPTRRASRTRKGVVAVALLRPGYYDREGKRSSGHDGGRRDTFHSGNNRTIAGAITELKAKYGPPA